MLRFCVLSIFLISIVFGQIVRDQRILIGSSRYARIIWDPQKTTSFVYAGVKNTELIILGVSSGKSNDVYCMVSSVTRIVTTPVGCNEFNNYVCDNNDGLNRVRLLDNWKKPVFECDSRKDCFGPLYPPGYLLSGVGPNCMIPAVTWPKFPPRSLTLIKSTCTYFAGNATFFDNTRAGFRNINSSIYYENGIYGVLFLRNFSTTDMNTILLIRATGSPYTIIYRSVTQHKFGVEIGTVQFRNESDVAIENCIIENTIYVEANQSIPLDPDTITDLNYHLQPEIPWYYMTRVCNHYVNRFSYLKETTAPYFPLNVPIGGYVIFKFRETPESIPLIPFEVKPVKGFEHYLSGCEHFYPKSSTFITDLGVEYNRAEPVIYSCYAPFIRLDLFGSSDTPDRKFQSCFRLGGTVNGITQDACVKHQTRQHCEKGWYFYDTGCFYKYPAQRQFARYKVSMAEAESVCNELGGTTYFTVSADTLEWILDRFLWYPPTILKLRFRITGQRCNCVYLQNDQSIVDPCDCNVPEFNLCRYLERNKPLVFKDIFYPPQVLTVLRDGQEGMPYDGRELICNCESGSSGKHCVHQSCLAPIEIASASIEEALKNPAIKFARICYKHGFCEDFRPWNCGCNPGFGPPSELTDPYDLHHDHPCSCPAIFIQGNDVDFQIDNTLYSNNEFGICNNYLAGYCDLEGSRGCISNTVIDVNADAFNERMATWSGRALSCKMPIILPGSGTIIQKGVCNGVGTCCPSGERLDEQIFATVSYDNWGRTECQPNHVGCVCDNGWGGEICTSIIPRYLIKERIGADGIITFPYSIEVFRVVGIEDYEIRVFKEQPCVGCTFGKYLVSLNPSLTVNSVVEIYNEDFPICGYNASPYMNRFFANEAWRSCESALVWNKFEFAKYGSTLTNCQCDINYSGTRCGLGVSAIRYELGTWKRYTCGSNVLPVRGFQTSNLCQCNAEFGFSGDACQCRHSCGKYGKCIKPKFIYGQCSKDLSEAAKLGEATRSISESTNYFIPYFVESSDGAILYIPGEGYWYFAEQSILDIENYSSDYLKNDDEFSHIPITIRHSCNSGREPPEKITGVAIIYSNPSSFITTTIDETIYYPPCSANPVVVYPCLSTIVSWDSVASENDDVLDEVTYENVMIFNRMSARRISPVLSETSYGFFDCQNPIDILIEASLICLGLITVPICPHDIYKASLGEAYGLFWDQHPNIKFIAEPEHWGPSQFRLLRSFLTSNWSDTSWDTYFKSIVTRILDEGYISVTGKNLTVTSVNYNSTGGTIYATGYDGNKYRRISNLTDRKINGLPGYWFSLGSNLGIVSSVYFKNMPVANITQLAIIAPNGKICGGYYGLITSSNISIVCQPGNNVEDLGDSLYRALNNGELSLYLNQTWEDWTVWFITNADVSGKTWEISVQSQNIDAIGIWGELKKSVLIDGVFPYATPENSLTDSQLIELYHVYLSPRKCINDFQCRAFGRTSLTTEYNDDFTCVFRTDGFKRLWLNGQPEPPVVALGDEGGCDCRYHPGIWETTSHCILCKHGYGPNTEEDWFRYIDSQVDLGLTIEPEDCTIPVSTSGDFCGGHGKVELTLFQEYNVDVTGWPSETNPGYYIIPRCLSVTGDLPLQISQHPDVIIYGNNNEVIVIGGERVFFQGHETDTIDCLSEVFNNHPELAVNMSTWFVEYRNKFTFWLVPQN